MSTASDTDLPVIPVPRAPRCPLAPPAAGNWDTEFVDNPDTFDADRNARGHLGFGYGVHQCIGQNLARVEMQVAFATLARRLPGLKLAVAPEELRFKQADLYGMKELPVTW